MISQEELGDQETVSPEFADARVDWIENPEAHVIKIDLPGVRREEVKVEVETGRILQIYGERRCEEEEEEEVGEKEKEKYFMTHRMERRSGKFHRLFKLPENAKMDLTEASMRNGVLTVTVPKEEVKVIEISDDSLMDQNDTVLRAKSTADKGKAVLEDAAKDVKRIEISGENSRCLKIIKMD